MLQPCSLNVDNACDKAFKDIEQRAGVNNLIGISVGKKTFSSGSSVHTMGEIAISKLPSSSHLGYSVSVYSES